MKLTLTLLFSCFAIYCYPMVLSLPPSLIANAAALGQAKTKSWIKKDQPNAILLKENINNNGALLSNELKDIGQQVIQNYDLNDFTDATHMQPLPHYHNEKIPPPQNTKIRVHNQQTADTYLTPLKFWGRHCKTLDYKNCPQEYYYNIVPAR